MFTIAILDVSDWLHRLMMILYSLLLTWVKIFIYMDNMNMISPPWDTIAETLLVKQIPLKHLIDKLALSDAHLLDLITGDLVIDEDLANKLNDLLGIDVNFWINRDVIYQ